MRKSLLLLLALTLLLGACSRVGLAYRNLDWLIPWKLGDYVTLSSEQSAWLKPRLQEHLAWHCSVELPRYLQWLETSQQALSNRDSAGLAKQLAAFDEAMQRVAVEITPSTTELLRGLSPRQVEQLFEELEKQNEKLREEFLAPSLEQQIAKRAERMSERLRPWFGKLNAQQTREVENWAQSLGAQNEIWLANRLAWQQALREALEVRRGDDFDVRMTALLQERERFYTGDYLARYEANRQAMAELIVALIEQADESQLERARKRLDGLHSELAAQQCQAPDGLAGR
ncbi:hypothetical protein DFO61_2559 [Ectopseudomonas oleovorans]|uniref:Lipoprotein n=1 Tax=Ectopseudomonas oleovorans TaxID=301 RepID=A0A397N3C5_ECTOL|nr:DUF6279 family lipoprotein [Pseudomonas oleovorans]RIA31830.1 hypothetical protein DFO61_2559 [Pseudomonas oleovorans]